MLNLTFKRLASDNVPESCGYDREVMLEALTGLCECQVLSPDKIHPDVHAVEERAWGQHSCTRKGESVGGLAGSLTLSERTKDNLRENREILCFTSGAMPGVRIVNPYRERR